MDKKTSNNGDASKSTVSTISDQAKDTVASNAHSLKYDSPAHMDPVNRKLEQFEEVDILKRDTFYHCVEVQEVGTLLTWSFSTRRKNIAFGLSFRPIAAPDVRLLTEQYKMVFQALTSKDFFITPSPKNDRVIYNQSRAHDHSSTLVGEDSDRMSIASSSIKKKSSLLNKLSSVSFSRTNNSKSNAASFNQDQYSLLMEGTSKTIDVLPVQKYESYRYQVTGYLCAPFAGVYVFIFDNSFSKHTEKQLFYHIEKRSSDLLKDLSKEPVIKTELNKVDVVIATWLLKRNKNRIQGWTKRWVEIRQGVLSWSDEPGGMSRGSVPLTSCIVTKVPDRRKLIFDSSGGVFHFQALNEEDYVNWVKVIVDFKNKKYVNISHFLS